MSVKSEQNSCLFHEDSGFLHLPMKHRLLMPDKKVRKFRGGFLFSFPQQGSIFPATDSANSSLHYKILYLRKEELQFAYTLCVSEDKI